MTHIKDVICPNCNAQADQPCTQPTDTGRKPVFWFHEARVIKAKELAQVRLDELKPDGYAVLYGNGVVNEDADPNGLDQPANLAYHVVIDDAEYNDDPVWRDHVWRTFGNRDVAIQKAIEHHRLCKGKADIFVTAINLDFGQILGNVLSLAATPEDGRPGYFNLD